jgi:hypothetical protein
MALAVVSTRVPTTPGGSRRPLWPGDVPVYEVLDDRILRDVGTLNEG